MAHLMFECLTYTGGPSYSLLRFLQKYRTVCRGKCAHIKAVLENRLQLLNSVAESEAWVPPLKNTKDIDYIIVGLIDCLDVYAHSSPEGVHAVCAV